MKTKIALMTVVLAVGTLFADMDRAEVEWSFPRGSCHEGMPFGNAESGFLVYGGGNTLKITVGRADTWDHRGGYDWNEDQSYTNIAAALQAKDMAKVKTLFRRGEVKPGEPKNPTIIPVGRFEFAIPAEFKFHRGVLSTATGLGAIVIAKGEDDAEAGIVRLALDRSSGALAVKWPDGIACVGKAFPAWQKEWRSTENEPPLHLSPPIRVAIEGGEGFVQPIPEDPAIGSGFVTANGETFMVAVRGKDAVEAGKNTVRILKERMKKGYAEVEKASVDFWKEWWSATPVIDIPDPIVKEIHDFGMYKFGSMTGPDGVPAPLQGPWIEDYRLPPWHGDYHFNINVQLCYWPAFRGNHLESLMPLFRMILGWKPLMREIARKFAGVEDGYMLPFSCDDRGRLIGGYWAGTMDFACTPWICQMMMRYVTMSGDAEFLRTEAYPFMKGTMNTLRAIIHDDGTALSYPVSTSPEFDKLGGWGRNSSFQLAATHRLVIDLIRAAEMLGEKPDPMWLDVKRRLPAASFKGGKSDGEIELWNGLTLQENHRHHSHLAGFVPFDIFDMEQGHVKDSLKKTLFSFEFNGMGWWSGWSYGWAAMLQTHWGNADAAEMLIRYWERMYTNPGHGSRHDVYFPGLSVMRRGTHARAYGVAGDAPGEEIMQIDGAMACTAAVQEMMVSESQGVTYVFRGAPERWRNCSFKNVLSDNGTLVSAARRKGKVDFVELKSKRGGLICLASPWRKGKRIDIRMQAGETRRVTASTGDGAVTANVFVPLVNGEVRDVGSGVYHFLASTNMEFYISNHDHTSPRKVHVPIVGVTNAVLRGHGAKFMFHGQGVGLLLKDTKNVRVEGISFDWARPMFSEGEVKEVKAGRTRVSFDQRSFPLRMDGGKLVAVGEEWIETQTLAHAFAENRTFLGSEWFAGKAEPAGDGSWWIDWEVPEGAKTMMVRSGYRPYPAVVLYRADDTLLQDVTVHSAFGMALLAQRSANVTLRGSKAAADRTCGVFPGEGRRTALAADATHFSNCRGEILIENCYFTGTVDDALNVHATCLAIEELLPRNRVRCRYVHCQSFGFETFLPGERITFIKGKTLENGPSLAVSSVEWLSPKEIVVTVDGELPLGFGKGDAVENGDFQPSVKFRNNIVEALTPRGCLLTTSGKVAVEGNVFERIHGPALFFSGDAQEWYESGSCNDVTIKDNVFRNLPLNPKTKAVIMIAPQVKDPANQKKPYHSGFKLSRNRFEDCRKQKVFGTTETGD
ncbi:MAG: hypothetical protein PHV28_02440 [Kiritimatiellae bacterium]|nr:hypothetical protein [Kiritimatiellia bacterium]